MTGGASLKSRLRASIVTLVTLLVLSQCLVSLHITAESHFLGALERSRSIAQQVRNLVLLRMSERLGNAPAAPQSWRDNLAGDNALAALLEKTVATSSGVSRILVCDDDGRVLAASDAATAQAVARSLADFGAWNQRVLWVRLVEVLTESRDYAILQDLGASGGQAPGFTLRVELSSNLLRAGILPQVRSLALVSLLSMLSSMLIGVFFSNAMLLSLRRLGRRIEQITTGEFTQEQESARESREFADVQSKLDQLSERFRGAREDASQLRANIERMLVRLEEALLLFDPDERLLVANLPTRRLLDRDHRDWIGKPLRQIFPAGSPLGDVLRQAIERRQSVRDHTVVWERRGGPLRLLVNLELLGEASGHRFGALLSLRDAETRRQIRTQLDVSSRLAAINRLTGGVAHEIKNPLNSMALHLEVLRARVAGSPEVDREVEVLGGEIARLDRVVKTFLDFARPVELHMSRIDLVPLLEQVVALVLPQARQQNVAVEFIPPPATAFLRADADLIKQAILNVVVNGLEAMPTGGRLLLRLDTTAEEFVIRVTDQGPGIPPEVRDKIFHLYFTTKQSGSGIGLAMTFRAIQLHNATIEFTSEPGQGTTFRLGFPVADDF